MPKLKTELVQYASTNSVNPVVFKIIKIILAKIIDKMQTANAS
jgi:hypothetical protein